MEVWQLVDSGSLWVAKMQMLLFFLIKLEEKVLHRCREQPDGHQMNGTGGRGGKMKGLRSTDW